MRRRSTPRNDSAFTLAEVLITLVIIGVIAALTIPNLMQKYQEQTTVKKVQKFYSNLSNAYNLAMKDNGTVEEWGITAQNKVNAEKFYKIFFEPYFKVSKNCGVTNTGNCIPDVTYKFFNNTPSNNWARLSAFYSLTLDDGAAVFFTPYIDTTNQITYIFIDYDVNGIKEPNQAGIDLFEFAIRKDKIFPSGLGIRDYGWRFFDNNCYTSGYGCTAWVVYKGNMDYLHCDGLKWTSRSCKEK